MQLEFVVIDGFDLGHLFGRVRFDLERAAATGSTRMAIFYYNPSPYGIASLKGAKQEAAKLGVQLDAFDANNNPQLQSTQIQDAITTGKYKAFWVWGLERRRPDAGHQHRDQQRHQGRVRRLHVGHADGAERPDRPARPASPPSASRSARSRRTWNSR